QADARPRDLEEKPERWHKDCRGNRLLVLASIETSRLHRRGGPGMKTRSRVRTARVVTFQPVVFFGLVIVLLLGLPLVTAAQTPSLNWGSEVNPSRCPNDQGYRYLELNVTRHVEGDVALNRRTRHA